MPSYAEVTQRAGSLRSMTGFMEAECTGRLPPFAHALITSMQDRTSDGQPRTSRRYSTYASCPLPTMADTRLFILTSVTQHPTHAMPGQLCGRSPSPAKPWIPRLHPVLHQTLADQAWLPARPADDLAARRATPPTAGASPSPLLGMRGAHDRSRGQPIRTTSTSTPVASRRATRANTAS
jgi:hypothetical protein